MKTLILLITIPLLTILLRHFLVRLWYKRKQRQLEDRVIKNQLKNRK